jgi:hypothetical protein
MLTVILAVFAGFMATGILVMITTAISAKIMLGSPMGAATPTTAFSIVSLVLGLAAAAAGGCVVRMIATESASASIYLAGLIGGLGLLMAVRTPVDQRRGQQGWYLYLLPLFGAVGALLGGGVIP